MHLEFICLTLLDQKTTGQIFPMFIGPKSLFIIIYSDPSLTSHITSFLAILSFIYMSYFVKKVVCLINRSRKEIKME